jgi:hypothetical protein
MVLRKNTFIALAMGSILTAGVALADEQTPPAAEPMAAEPMATEPMAAPCPEGKDCKKDEVAAPKEGKKHHKDHKDGGEHHKGKNHKDKK